MFTFLHLACFFVKRNLLQCEFSLGEKSCSSEPMTPEHMLLSITCCEDEHDEFGLITLYRAHPWRLYRQGDVFPMAYPFLPLQVPFHHYGSPRPHLIDRALSTPS